MPKTWATMKQKNKKIKLVDHIIKYNNIQSSLNHIVKPLDGK